MRENATTRFFFALLFLVFTSNSFGQITVTFKGQIKNPNSDSLLIQQQIDWGTINNITTIKVAPDGAFNAKITVPNKGLYKVNDGTESGTAFFKNKAKLMMYIDTKQFDETITFKGDGALESNYIAEKYLLEEGMGDIAHYSHYGTLPEVEFLKLNDSILGVYNSLLNKYPKLDKDLAFSERSFQNLNSIRRIYNYPTFYRYLIGSPVDLSESYPNAYEGFDVNNEAYIGLFNFMTCVDDYTSYLYSQDAQNGISRSNMYYIERINIANQYISNKRVKEEIVYYITRYNMKRSKDIDSCFNLFNSIVKNEEYREVIRTQYNQLKIRAVGAPSPKFSFKDKDGNITHLDSLLGKVVYIDIWATWCSPCIKEIPNIKKLKDTLKGKNAVIVSICKGDTRERWLKAIEKYDLGGIQLFAESTNDKFFLDYSSTGYPHFILIGKDGRIISPSGLRPDNPKLLETILQHL